MPPVNYTCANETSSPCLQLIEQLLSQNNAQCNCNNTSKNSSLGKSELEALLYIVVTLLFYSLGIIVGIILYLKREKKEIQEDRVFHEFITDFEPESRSRFDKVQQVIARLQFLSERKEKTTNKMGSEEKKVKNMSGEMDNKSENCAEKSVVNSEYLCQNIGSLGDDEEPLSSIVAKLIDPEKRQSRETVFTEDGDIEIIGGITKTESMQSIKDYTEEPGRSGRSSLAYDDDEYEDNKNNEGNESSALLSEEGQTENIEKDVETDKPLNRGCVVTNV